MLDEFDCNKYRKQLFGMFSGEAESVTLEFDKSLIDVIFDKFGEKTQIKKYGECYRTTVDVVVSQQFFGFILGLGDRMKMVEPEGVVQGLREYMKITDELYN